MKRYFKPQANVVRIEYNDILATSGVYRGTDIGDGENVECDSHRRDLSIWDEE